MSNSLTFVHFSRWSVIILAALFGVICLVYDYDNILFQPPQSIHLWRQADCLSITSNYFEGNAFFSPSVHNLGQDGTGKTVSEFPLLYYLIGKIWLVTGVQYWIYRLLVLILFFLACASLLKIVEMETGNSLLGLFVSILLFTSPVMAYYAGNFLMNIPAFSFACMGLYYFFRFKATGTTRSLIGCTLFYMLAALFKISSLLSFLPIVILFVWEKISTKSYNTRIFQWSRREVVLLALVFLIPVLWFIYAATYNARYNSGFFLIGILPIWQMSFPNVLNDLSHILEHFKWDFFRPVTEWLLSGVLVFVLIFSRILPRYLLVFILVILMGGLAFGCLFFQALAMHDYYVIDLYIFLPILLLAFFRILQLKFPQVLRSNITYLVLIILLIHNIDFGRRRISSRYSRQGWANQNYSEIFESFTELEPILKELGISRDKLVLSLSDESINISLYFMNRKGWTNYATHLSPDIIRERINQGAEYLFIGDTETSSNAGLQSFLRVKVGSFRNIDIYRLERDM